MATSPTTIEQLQVGALFADRYELLSVLGQGAMGKVFCARDAMLNDQIIALKVLNPNLCAEEAHMQRFLREVQLTREISHPNVVRTFDVGSVGGLPYFTMEFVEGQTLQQAIDKSELDLEKSLKILKVMANALDAIHEKGVIHRDLKPSNILLTPKGEVRLMDFGVARPQVSRLTANDELVGSATHMAPEIWRQTETTFKADLYSLGIVAYEMVTGVLPFDGNTAYEMMWKHLKFDPINPTQIDEDIPSWVSELILEMLKKDPKQRPASGKAIASRIELGDLSDAHKEDHFDVEHLQPLRDLELKMSPPLDRKAPNTTYKPKVEEPKYTPEPLATTLRKAISLKRFALATLVLVVSIVLLQKLGPLFALPFAPFTGKVIEAKLFEVGFGLASFFLLSACLVAWCLSIIIRTKQLLLFAALFFVAESLVYLSMFVYAVEVDGAKDLYSAAVSALSNLVEIFMLQVDDRWVKMKLSLALYSIILLCGALSIARDLTAKWLICCTVGCTLVLTVFTLASPTFPTITLPLATFVTKVSAYGIFMLATTLFVVALFHTICKRDRIAVAATGMTETI